MLKYKLFQNYNVNLCQHMILQLILFDKNIAWGQIADINDRNVVQQSGCQLHWQSHKAASSC